jgi:tRNA (Thr-GGU) A37 N-methylase
MILEPYPMFIQINRSIESLTTSSCTSKRRSEGVHTEAKEEVLDPAEVVVTADALAAVRKLHHLHLLHHWHFVEQVDRHHHQRRGGEARRGVLSTMGGGVPHTLGKPVHL